MPTPGQQYHVPNLERALHAMETLAVHPEGLTISDVAGFLAIPRNSAFRILNTLLAHEYVLRDDDTQRFRLGGKLLGLGCRATGTDRLLELSQDVLRRIRDETRETTLLGRLVNSCGVVVQQLPGTHAVRVHVEPGTQFPLHTAAPAKAILANVPTTECTALLKGIRFQKFTNSTITNRKDLFSQFDQYRSDGYATDVGEEVEGINCIAAPVFDFRSQPVAAIWITGPDTRVPLAKFDEIGTLLKQHAARISGRFGYIPDDRSEK